MFCLVVHRHVTWVHASQFTVVCLISAVLPILGLGAQLCLITALESESAATIAIVQNLDAVFSYTFQVSSNAAMLRLSRKAGKGDLTKILNLEPLLLRRSYVPLQVACMQTRCL